MFPRSGITLAVTALALAVVCNVARAQTLNIYYLPGAPYDYPNGITAGPDGALWFTDFGSQTVTGYIGRISMTGQLSLPYVIPFALSQPFAITSGPDGALW